MNRALALLIACGFWILPSRAPAAHFDQTVFATVGWSEWCPPGYVLVDLEIGHFEWIAQLPRTECARAKTRSIVKGELSKDDLESLRQTAARARETGFIRAKCEVVISNAGGPYILVLSGPRESMSAPNDLSCWSAGATNLHRLLERLFDRRTRPIPK